MLPDTGIVPFLTFSYLNFFSRFGRSAGSVSDFMPKNSLRRKLLSRRHALPLEQQLAKSRAIQTRFVATELFREARSLGLYSPVNSEVLTDEIFSAALSAGKKVVFPRVREHHLDFIEVRGQEDLRKGAFGIQEPVGEQVTPLNELDVLVVPGVVFDAQGGRLGYGKGFFDRGLDEKKLKPFLVGLCYEIQLVTFLPKENHDVLMDALVTERRMLWMKKRTF